MKRSGIGLLGIGLFLLGFLGFIGLKFLEKYQVDPATLTEVLGPEKASLVQEVANPAWFDQSWTSSFPFQSDVRQLFTETDALVLAQKGFTPAMVERIADSQSEQNIVFDLEKAKEAVASMPKLQQAFVDNGSWLAGKSYADRTALAQDVRLAAQSINQQIVGEQGIGANNYQEIVRALSLVAFTGPIEQNTGLFLLLTVVLSIVGALLAFIPYWTVPAGIKNDNTYFSALKYRGSIGIAVGVFLITFYIILYFQAQHMVPWIKLVDPVSYFLSGGPASQWFLYGFLYTLCIAVMGIRMYGKYRRNRYQLIRTTSVILFQLVFAFLLPQIMALLNQPAQDLKSLWPLDYSFFFNYHIDQLIESGGFGIFILVWGIVAVIVAVPVLTYFLGKRWYCSWVCGCGGLAETLGDPYRHLSDKSVQAWQIERPLIHSVLVFAVVMTGMVLYSYFGGSLYWSLNRIVLMALVAGALGFLVVMHRKNYPSIDPTKIYRIAALFLILIAGWQLYEVVAHKSWTMGIDSYKVREIYGFAIGAVFAGVVGTGFYPLMGNRVWCRFGCPLAAYLGLVQRFKSRFRITTNGGQCISCGNCSTYCEMGIDVRAYAQRQQDIVRSSCVGCGVCSAVCPRGVLNLENSTSPRNI